MGKVEKHTESGTDTESGERTEPPARRGSNGRSEPRHGKSAGESAPAGKPGGERDEEAQGDGRSAESFESSPQADGVPEDEEIGG